MMYNVFKDPCPNKIENTYQIQWVELFLLLQKHFLTLDI